MPTIDLDQPVVTLVNVFTVDPGDRDKLLAILDEATQNVMRHLPGFVSASVHVSLDGTQVCNYAQWESEEHFREAIAHPDAQPHFAACREIAEVRPGLYRLVFTEQA